MRRRRKNRGKVMDESRRKSRTKDRALGGRKGKSVEESRTWVIWE